MKQVKTLAALVLSTILFFSCSKDDAAGGDTSKRQLLTSAPWKMIAYTSNPAEDWNGDGIKETDVFSIMESCEKDDLFIFKTNGDVVIDYKTKCEGDNGPNTATEKWALRNNDKTLMLSEYVGADEDEFEIVELTATRLKIKDSYTYDGVTSTTEITFGH